MISNHWLSALAAGAVLALAGCDPGGAELSGGDLALLETGADGIRATYTHDGHETLIASTRMPGERDDLSPGHRVTHVGSSAASDVGTEVQARFVDVDTGLSIEWIDGELVTRADPSDEAAAPADEVDAKRRVGEAARALLDSGALDGDDAQRAAFAAVVDRADGDRAELSGPNDCKIYATKLRFDSPNVSLVGTASCIPGTYNVRYVIIANRERNFLEWLFNISHDNDVQKNVFTEEVVVTDNDGGIPRTFESDSFLCPPQGERFEYTRIFTFYTGTWGGDDYASHGHMWKRDPWFRRCEE